MTSDFAEAFVESRPRLLSVAHRILGSIHDAEDALQTAWLRVHTTSASGVEDPAAWLTTVVTRVCLDQLRDRRRRQDLTRRLDAASDVDVAADEEFLRREDVSRALMVLLARLTPSQRVAYVLHDLFAVPFDEVADVLGTTQTNAKKHASRARSRIRPTGRPSPTAPDDAKHGELVAAFLRAAGGGDVSAMLVLMAPDCVRVADRALIPAGTATRVTGSAAVAEETRLFVARIRASTPMRVNGRLVHVIAPGGHPVAVVEIATRGGLIAEIAIAPLRPADVVRAA